jgi:hypothetical protein
MVHASPVDAAPGPEAADRWWRPAPADVLRHLGWRWVLVLPAVCVVGFLVAAFFYPALFQLLFWVGLKWGILALALPFMLLGDLVRRAAQQRHDPFCIHCGYTLIGLPAEGRCPECGSAYTPQLIEEYRRDPQWFIQRYRARHQLPRGDTPFDAGPVRRRKSRDGT